MKCFVVDLEKCCGCYNCQFACKDEHVENDWTPYAKPQPDTGHFWIKVEQIVRGGQVGSSMPKVKLNWMVELCMHCDNPPCIPACPVGAITKRDDGLVLINPATCNGCKYCIDVCPYGAIYFNEDLRIAQKCTGCAHLIDKGWKLPRCVDACPTEALKFGEYEELSELIAKAEVLKPELNVKPRVYYINLPTLFITGAVYSPEEDECIEGASVTATDLASGKIYVTTTDIYGDFWLEKLEKKHTYSLKIEKEGYYPKTIGVIYMEKDVNLGDIALFKAP